MIISISPPSSISLKSMEKQTRVFFEQVQSIKKSSHGLLATGDRCMVLVNKREILLSFNDDDVNTITLLRNYLTYLFKDVYIGVDLDNPVTEELNFVVKFPRGVVS